jgi:cephalosporin hydroxylase
MDEVQKFKKECSARVSANVENKKLVDAAKNFSDESIKAQYSYNFSWMGRPIIQYPQDIVAMQEIIWNVKPDLIIETGIAHGGSLIMYASFMEMMGLEKGHVLGIDIDIRGHNGNEINAHPMSKRITMFEGSAIASDMIQKVKDFAVNYKTIMVVLDSNHTHHHVLEELKAYSDLVSKNSYCVVFDTVVEDMPEVASEDRPWGVGDNPKTAVWEFLKSNDDFEIDKSIQNKILVTVAPDGYLKRVN